MPSLATVATVGLLMVGSYAVGQHRPVGQQDPADSTIPRNLLLDVAQARCGLWVFEDGSADFEASDTARNRCYQRILGEPLFRNHKLRD